ncbi:MAG: type II toxin-antitoxin system HicB family antitoxin [bacterium]
MVKNKQKISQYPAVFEKSEEGVYNVSFPAFPGCVTFGNSLKQAKKKSS